MNERTAGMLLVVLLALAVRAEPLLRASFEDGTDAASRTGLVRALASGDPQRVEGRAGKALYIREGDWCAWPIEGVFPRDTGSIEMWIRPSWPGSDGKRRALLTDSARVFKVFKHVNNLLYVQVGLQGESRVIQASSPVSWKAGEWHRVAIAWSGMASAQTEATLALYLDGALAFWTSAQDAMRQPGDRLYVGSDVEGRFPFEGAIDEVQVLAKPSVSLEKPERLPLPDGTPTDDPYLSSTAYLPPEVRPDPIHNLDAIDATQWTGFPAERIEEYFGDSAAQRAIYRDSVTGAEVWLLARTPAHEGVSYTNMFPFNADGSRIRVDGIGGCMRSDGSELRILKRVIPHEYRSTTWSRDDPDVVICHTANGGAFEFDLRTEERRDIYMPGPDVREGTNIQFSDDGGRSMFVTRQGAGRPFWLYLGDGEGKDRREIDVKSVSPQPDKDVMGSAAFLRDRHGRLYARYSLNKGRGSSGPTPYQNWLVDLDGKSHRPMDSHNNLLDGTPLHFVPAGSRTVAGHGGYSPSMEYFVHHRGRPGYKWVRDLATWTQRDIARIPGCDHMDWTVDNNWFFVWAKQKGLPIYKTFVDTGVTQRIVASNSCPHQYAACPYHAASPDGTKLLYKSAMLGSIDLYMAIVRHPEPPKLTGIRRQGDAVVLTWGPPDRSREVAGYNVYRGARSGRDYRRLNREPIRELTFRDSSPPGSPSYALTSVEHSGLESREFSRQAGLELRGHVTVFWEAERGKLEYPMREIFRPADCSANFAIDRASRDPMWNPVQGIGVATWVVEVPALSFGARPDTNPDRQGTIAGLRDAEDLSFLKDLPSRKGFPAPFYLWARARSRSGEKKSFSVTVDERQQGSILVEGPEWRWTRLSTDLLLKGGKHAIRAEIAQAGVEVDKLMLTSSVELTPGGLGDAPSSPPEAPESLSARWDDSGQFVLLNWQPRPSIMFHHYQVHKGHAPDFAPHQRNLIGSPTRSAFIDPRPSDRRKMYYRVVAVDTWGNASRPSEPDGVEPATRGGPERHFVDLAAAERTKGAGLREDDEAGAGRCLAFGDPDEVPEYAGEASISVDLEPGRYWLWLRSKGGPMKSAAFFWVTLGDTEHYSRMHLAQWGREHPWNWKRVTFLKSVGDPRERPMSYVVTKRPTVLKIRHRANFVAFDQAFVTNASQEVPSPEARQVHPGCPEAFEREE